MSRQAPIDPDSLVEVFSNIDYTLVCIARDQLDGCKIASFIFDQFTANAPFSQLRMAVPNRLMVQQRDAAEAREILKELGFL